MNKYDDIINIKHFEPKYHERMSIKSRAAQFAPFKSLVGFYDELDETSRLTNSKKELDEDKKNTINRKLKILKQNLQTEPKIEIIYFEKDKTKSGGGYIQKIDFLKNIDDIHKEIILSNQIRIPFNYIL